MVPTNWKWRHEPPTALDTVIVDIDGVLADASHRQHLLAGPVPDWRAFYERGVDDLPIAAMAGLLEALRADRTITMLSARPLWAQPDTIEWFDRHGLRWDLLIMREWPSGLDAPSFKARSVAELRSHGYEPSLAFDDDPRNVAMFEAAGIPCVYVHSGYYGLMHLQ
ncbi:MAG: hypothetical protein GX868_15190 [Actinobacteria bacterium]|nr:hypothetical protein [Actinomycetota bacterium]